MPLAWRQPDGPCTCEDSAVQILKHWGVRCGTGYDVCQHALGRDYPHRRCQAEFGRTLGEVGASLGWSEKWM